MNMTVDADGRVRRDRDRARLGLAGARPRAPSRSSRAAAPFGRFTRRCARKPTSSSITSRFQFTRDERLETDAAARSAERRHGPLRRSSAIPVEHSQSPFIHAAFARADRRGDCATTALLVPARRLCRHGARASPPAAACGCNVTVPFKFEACALAARSHAARRAGAGAATAALRSPTAGSATTPTASGSCATSSQRRRARCAGARVLLIGAGGARGRRARAAARGAARAELVVANRTPTRRAPLVRPARARRAARRRCCALRRWTTAGAAFDIVVNASASSLPARRCRCAGTVLRPGALALDMMYGPPARAVPAWARGAWRDRPRRPGHAGRAGGRGLLLLARRAPADRAGAAALRAAAATHDDRRARPSVGRLLALLLLVAARAAAVLRAARSR